ncbi:rhomboid family intramembrane serine protease [Protaetiibacter intestinalis]|uniref:Rhomboid family intramembrane serine protease n=1 Tax=Protaetiibacter intestinalis TaxID=2419774 RepID=A0A387B7X4_9MICO|nr:rhomboid family intramembrane serine protease [Protaetiibacter intestinalis]AYF97848.1 rhomboid family intramembrane serine protease [Protaetiibacter intestinalis]
MSSPRFGEQLEDDPSVCYRHPDRQSWVLCQRCGRTICPECQILAPVGVQCPDCVREAGGSVTWSPASAKQVKQRTAARGAARRPSARGRVANAYLDGSSGPHLSWIVVAVSALLWALGFFTNNAPILLLGSSVPGQQPWELWRYLTAFLTQVSVADGGFILLTLVNFALFAWFGPIVERFLGRRRFLFLFLFSAVCGSAIGTLAGGVAYGLSGALFGVFAAFAVSALRSGLNVTLLLVLMGFNLVYTAVANLAGLPQLVAGLIAGVGGWWLLENRGEHGRQAYWIGAGIAAGLILLSTLRLIALG